MRYLGPFFWKKKKKKRYLGLFGVQYSLFKWDNDKAETYTRPGCGWLFAKLKIDYFNIINVKNCQNIELIRKQSSILIQCLIERAKRSRYIAAY